MNPNKTRKVSNDSVNEESLYDHDEIVPATYIEDERERAVIFENLRALKECVA